MDEGDRTAAAHRHSSPVRKMLDHGIVQAHLASLHGDGEQQRGEHLGDGADLEHHSLRRTRRIGQRSPRSGRRSTAIGRTHDEEARPLTRAAYRPIDEPL